MAAKKKAAAKKAAAVKPAPAAPAYAKGAQEFLGALVDWLESLPPEVNDDRKARLVGLCRAQVG